MSVMTKTVTQIRGASSPVKMLKTATPVISSASTKSREEGMRGLREQKDQMANGYARR